MSVLSRIRNNMGLVVAVVAIAILGFILTDLLSSLGGIVSGPEAAGEVAGVPITREEFGTRLQAQMQQYPNLPESQRGFVRDQVWRQIVSDKVFEKEFANVGMRISNAEVYDMFAGKNIHPLVRQSFTPPGGEFDPAMVRQQLENLIDNPEFTEQLKQFEDYLARSRGVEMYSNMVKAGYIGSKALAQRQHEEQNRKAEINYLVVNYSTVPDSAINITDSDLRDYISDNPKRYQQEEETYVRYVKFDILADAQDSAKAKETLTKLRSSFAGAPNDSIYTANKSRTPFQNSFKTLGSLPAGLKDSISGAEAGQVFGPFLEQNYYKFYKVVDIEEGEETFVNINHILITPDGASEADSAEARSKAAQLARTANNSNFFDLANENSRDFATKTKGGSLGWYAKGSFGEDFDEAVEGLPVGSIRGPIKSRRGYHVVQVVAKSNKTYKVAEIEREIYAGSATVKRVFQAANQFLLDATREKDIDSAAVKQGLNAIRSNPLNATAQQVAGLQGGRDVVLWALQADEGDFSEVLQIGESYVCAQVVEKKDEGLRDLEDVRLEVTREVMNEKKAEVILNKFKGIEIGEDLEAIRAAYGDGAFVSSASGISFSSTSIAGIGNDPFIIGRISTLQEGEVAGPLKGQNGVAVVKIVRVAEASSLEDETLATKRDTDVSGQKTQWQNKIESALIELADVKDERYKAGY